VPRYIHALSASVTGQTAMSWDDQSLLLRRPVS
jgi:hypothetical protein